jgi:hypothetical protein
MKKVYVLLADHGYEGYGVPNAAWSYRPSEQEIHDYLVTRYLSNFPAYGYQTIEETNAYISEILWKGIRERKWVIKECDLLS